MSNYAKITDYAAKDVLLTGNPSKIVKGTEIGADFDAIAVAVATKADSASPVFTGVSNFAAGSVGAPSIYLSTDTTTGFYRIGANNVGFAVSGVKVLDISSTGLGVAGGLTANTAVITANATAPIISDRTGSGSEVFIGKFGGTQYLSLSGNATSSSFNTAAGIYHTHFIGGTEVVRVTSTGESITGTFATTGTIVCSSRITGTALTANGAEAIRIVARTGTEDSQIVFRRFDGTTLEGIINGVTTGIDFYGPAAAKVLALADAGLTLTGTFGASGGAWFGTAALATGATTGHVYIQTSAGAPTGVPAAKTGQVAIQYDTTNNFLYIYNGGWKKSTVYA